MTTMYIDLLLSVQNCEPWPSLTEPNIFRSDMWEKANCLTHKKVQKITHSDKMYVNIYLNIELFFIHEQIKLCCTNILLYKQISYSHSQLITRPGPHLFGPEGTSLLCVLQIIPDDIGLLEEQAHGVGQCRVLSHLRVFQLGCGKKLGQTNAHQPGNVMAILQNKTSKSE